MKVLTEAEFDWQWSESLILNNFDYDVQGFGEVNKNVSKWSEDNYKWTEFASGIELILSNEIFYCDHSVVNQHDELQTLVSKFYLSGHHSVVSPNIENIEPEYIEKAGQNYLFYLPNIEEIEQFYVGTPLKKVVVEIDLNCFRSFVGKLDSVPQQLRPLIEQDDPLCFHRSVGKVTPMMRKVIKQMWQHPYQGAIARIYLEGKTLELLAMQLTQLAESELDVAKSVLKPKNIDPIYAAKDILSGRLEDPPSILELAEQVGVSDRTLRSGFRKLFGTTVIGYLNQQRMQKAKVILRTKQFSVAEVANSVGYSHLSHFSAAFKRQHGITPRECLAGKLKK